jgi:hypothetical protein
LVTKVFELSVIFGLRPLGLFIFTGRKNCFYKLGKSVFSNVRFTLPGFSFYFSWQFRPLKTQNSWVAINKLPQGSANGPVTHSRKHTLLQAARIVQNLQAVFLS